MGVLKDIKKGWQMGRDEKIYKSQSKQKWKEFDDTNDMLDAELGEGERNPGELWSDRKFRVYQTTALKPWDELDAKYPMGFDKEKKELGIVGLLTRDIAKELPRKKKCSCKPKRKVIKKTCKKK